MFLELHMIQNFAPSNLNRDDTGRPKGCVFGGYRRARISSQAIKRAIRKSFDDSVEMPLGARAVRTKRITEELARRLAQRGRDAEMASQVAQAALSLVNIKVKEGKSEYLLYLGRMEVDRLTDFCDSNWDVISALESSGRKQPKLEGPLAALAKGLRSQLDGGKAADVALFGRMLADLPDANIDAACQVAHAISTHQVDVEFDYYTAVDDLKPDDTSGADMIGTVEFNSACYYRYANLDLDQLLSNLGGDTELAQVTTRAFLTASAEAIPTGKQNSFAARNAPAFVLAVVRERECWSLANAFVRPVPPGSDGIILSSVAALDRHWGELESTYGLPPGATVVGCGLGQPKLEHLAGKLVPTYAGFVHQVIAACDPAFDA